MLTRPGPGSNGYNFQAEYVDWDCVVVLASNGTCVTGQVLCRDLTAQPGPQGADIVVLPTSANAGPVYGVYQGPPFTNTTGTTARFPITVRKSGFGVITKAATGVSIGTPLVRTSNLLAQPAPPFAEGVAPPAATTFIGTATATGSVILPGATLPGGTCNVLIQVP